MDETDNSALVAISKAEQALESAAEINEILNLRDVAAGYAVIAAARDSKELAQKSKIFQLKAERKAGNWLKENVVQGGHNSKLQDATLLPDGVDKWESSRWKLQAVVPEDDFNQWIDDCISTNKEITAAGLRRLASGMFPRLTTRAAAHLNLSLALICNAIKDHDKEYLLEPDTEMYFEKFGLPYDLILDWVEGGCKTIEAYLCGMLNNLYHEPMIEEKDYSYEYDPILTR